MVERHPPAILIADAVALDFLNSVARPTDSVIDWIDSGEGFLGWLGAVGLTPPKTLVDLRAQALPWELDKVAEQSRQLREWFRGIVALHKGRPLPVAALKELEPLNRLLERGESYNRIVPRHDLEGRAYLGLQPMRRWRSPDSLLLPVAEVLASFICNEDLTDVKRCEGPACTLMFVDRTPTRKRRWCSMEICGNRAKQAAHRNRVKGQHRLQTLAPERTNSKKRVA
jgi:predicted RNA-binding Zn ribbon-like protein